MEKRILSFGLVVFLSFGVFATPTISDVKVTPIPPWGIAIDYNLSGAEEVDSEDADSVVTLRVEAIDGGITNVATSLSGEKDYRNGAHRVYWNMSKDGIASKTTTGVVSVSYCRIIPRVYCIVDLSGGSETNTYPISYVYKPPSDGFTNEVYKTTKLVLKRVDAGSFIMGDDQSDESHRVTLTKSFYMGLFEVTQKQWELVMGSNPCSSTWYGAGDAYPVHYVSYNMIRGSSEGANWPATNSVDSSSFLGKLRDRTKLDFDLPTEAQWEYACRAGTTTTYSYGDNANGDYMWYTGNSEDSTHEVGTKKANPWGFYDMHGNVWEWCLDLDWNASLMYGEDPKGSSSGWKRVFRGGCWFHAANLCTSSYRGCNSWTSTANDLGFRLSLPIH